MVVSDLRGHCDVLRARHSVIDLCCGRSGTSGVGKGQFSEGLLGITFVLNDDVQDTSATTSSRGVVIFVLGGFNGDVVAISTSQLGRGSKQVLVGVVRQSEG